MDGTAHREKYKWIHKFALKLNLFWWRHDWLFDHNSSCSSLSFINSVLVQFVCTGRRSYCVICPLDTHFGPNIWDLAASLHYRDLWSGQDPTIFMYLTILVQRIFGTKYIYGDLKKNSFSSSALVLWCFICNFYMTRADQKKDITGQRKKSQNIIGVIGSDCSFYSGMERNFRIFGK